MSSLVSGLLLVNKPQGITSHDVVSRVRKAMNQREVGHTGTLDPLATGLMILVLGEATKLSDYLVMNDKRYLVKAQLGVTTDTLDRMGQVLSECPCHFSSDELKSVAESLVGEFEWPIPLFSAKKVDGKKLYEYGRSGQAVDLPSKLMHFWDIDVFEAGGQFLEVALSCSKGSFIRTWVDELGKKLGVGAIVSELTRLQVGPWGLEQSISLEEIEANPVQLGKALVSMSSSLPSLKSVVAAGREIRLVSGGQIPAALGARLIYEQKQATQANVPMMIKVIDGSGALLAILAAEPRQGLKIRRVFRSFT